MAVGLRPGGLLVVGHFTAKRCIHALCSLTGLMFCDRGLTSHALY